MVDSVKIKIEGRPKQPLPSRHRVEHSGVRIWYDGVGLFKFETELPLLLFGVKGKLIVTQQHLAQAEEKLRSIIASLVDVESSEWTLVDLVWQVHAPAKSIILAYQWYQFPGIRSLPAVFGGGQSISWGSFGSRLKVLLYDKSTQLKVGTDVLRAEIRLAGQQLRKRIDQSKRLDFQELYKVYRGLLIKLHPVEIPDGPKRNMAQIAAELSPIEQNVVISRYSHGRSIRTVQQFKKDMSKAQIKNIKWDWRTVFPADGPPPPVTVEPKPKGQEI